MADWVVISSLATAGGTLGLAAATYASVRSANRSASVAELALQEQRRPTLVQSRADDLVQSIGFVEGRRVSVPGGGAAVEAEGDVVYLVLSLRNVGAGIAVLQGWHGHPVPDVEQLPEAAWRESVLGSPPDVEEFRPLGRDQYIPGGDVGLWQAAVRDPADPLHATLMSAATERQRLSLDLLYTDQSGGQRTISRFGVLPGDDDRGWVTVAIRHWYLDAPAPR